MQEPKNLRLFAEQIRLETFKEFASLGFGHIGGAMSVVETLAVLYGSEMSVNPDNPKDPDRDYLVISKGHAGPALYATLALKGYFPLEQLQTLNKPGTSLPSHCDRNKTTGVDMTTGSLGQGMSSALGIALGNRMSGRNNRTYLIIGDGECDEGQIWEGALFAPQYKLDNITLFVDYNRQQLDGFVKNVMDLGDLRAKFASFGWNALEVDGHNVDEIRQAVRTAKETKGMPTAIILHTEKGHGCYFAAGNEFNHHIAFKPEEIQKAIEDAEAAVKAAQAM